MENYTIKREQILEMQSWGNVQDKEKVKKWFPEAFKLKLEVGKWYQHPKFERFIFCFNGKGYSYSQYGFNPLGVWSDTLVINCNENYIQSTNEKVEVTLKNEAIKRGYKVGVNFDSFGQIEECNGEIYFYFGGLRFDLNNGMIYDEGKWSEIIETITKEEAEKFLNKRIKL